MLWSFERLNVIQHKANMRNFVLFEFPDIIPSMVSGVAVAEYEPWSIDGSKSTQMGKKPTLIRIALSH